MFWSAKKIAVKYTTWPKKCIKSDFKINMGIWSFSYSSIWGTETPSHHVYQRSTEVRDFILSTRRIQLSAAMPGHVASLLNQRKPLKRFHLSWMHAFMVFQSSLPLFWVSLSWVSCIYWLYAPWSYATPNAVLCGLGHNASRQPSDWTTHDPRQNKFFCFWCCGLFHFS